MATRVQWKQLNKVVTAAGTGEPLTGEPDAAPVHTMARSVLIHARKVTGANAGNIYVGDLTVDKTANQGILLANNASPLEIPVPAGCRLDLSTIWIDAATSADGVIVFYTD